MPTPGCGFFESHETVSNVVVSKNGASELATYWKEPDFDATKPAFFYVRVLDVERERWTSLEAKLLNVTFEGKTPDRIRDRAYSSPIWYEP